MDEKLAMAVEVLPNIYLGDTRAARSKAFFDKVNIGAVLNMTPNIPNAFCSNNDLEYLRIPVYDSVGKRDVNKMFDYFPVVTEYMYKVTVIEDKKLLVHCALGRQRSCSAVGAYLIKFYKMTPIDAMDYIVERKPDAFHWGNSANFSKSLNKWYHTLAGKKAKIETRKIWETVPSIQQIDVVENPLNDLTPPVRIDSTNFHRIF